VLIDPSNLSSYPLPSSSELTLYRVADQVVKAVRECKPFILDITGRKKLKLEKALHFESYDGIQVRCIDRLFDNEIANQEVDDSFLHDLASNLHTKLMEQIPIWKAFQMFSIPNCHEFYSYCEQFPTERDNPAMRCFRLFLTWKKYDSNGASYQSLCTTLDKYSIFCGRNPVSYWLKLVESTPFECFCDVFTCRYQWWSMLAAVRQEEHPLEWRTRAPSEHFLSLCVIVSHIMSSHWINGFLSLEPPPSLSPLLPLLHRVAVVQ